MPRSEAAHSPQKVSVQAYFQSLKSELSYNYKLIIKDMVCFGRPAQNLRYAQSLPQGSAKGANKIWGIDFYSSVGSCSKK